MSIYRESDLDLLGENIDKILEDVKKKELVLFEPTGTEQRKVTEIILNYVKEKKRKLYGGFALNQLIAHKSPKDKIYTELDVPDIDIYTPYPLQDLVDICDLLHKHGFKSIQGKEAMHKETYSIFVNHKNGPYCDLSYVPKNIYNKMPFKEIKGLHLIHPTFMTIDYLRMFSDPLLSYQQRLEKAFKRFFKLQKFYPIPSIEKPLDVKFTKAYEPEAKNIINSINNYVVNKDTLIMIGFYAYNVFLNESGIMESKVKNVKSFSLIDLPYFEIVSTKFREDGLALLNYIKTAHPSLSKDIRVVEHYPFFQFLGHSAYIYYKKSLLCILYHHNNRCTPYLTVPAINVNDGKLTLLNGNINIGSFTVTLMYALMTSMKGRVDGNEGRKDLYQTMSSHLLQLRNYYLDKQKKTVFDITLFQDFLIDCKGNTMPVAREHRLIIESRKKKKQKYGFSYDPATEYKPDLKYGFVNSSGNAINNERNLKLTVAPPEEDEIEGPLEDVDVSESDK